MAFWQTFAVLVLLKVTMIVGAALFIDRILRDRATALMRHRLWSVAIALALSVPWVGSVLPAWSILPLGSTTTTFEEEAVGDWTDQLPLEPATVAVWGERPQGQELRADTASRAAGGPASTRRNVRALGPDGGTDLAAVWHALWIAVLVLWGLGSVHGGVQLLIALARERRYCRSSVPASTVWLGEGRRLAQQLGIRRTVHFGESAEIETPMTGGVFRPTVLIPRAARSWGPSRRRVVLAHELMHIRRMDAVQVFGGRILACFYWFHPLISRALMNVQVAREEACDEAVLAMGNQPSDYARHLLAISSSIAEPHPAGLLPMAQTNPQDNTRFEGRLIMILDPNRPRRSSTLAVLFVVSLFFAGVAMSSVAPRVASTAPAVSEVTEDSTVSDATSRLDPVPGDLRFVSASAAVPPTPASANETELGLAWLHEAHHCGSGRQRDLGGVQSWTSVQNGEDAKNRELGVVFRPSSELFLCFASQGAIDIDPSGQLAIGQNGRVQLHTESGLRNLRLDIRSVEDGDPIYTFEVDGRIRPLDTVGRRWLDSALSLVATRQIIGHANSGRGRIGAGQVEAYEAESNSQVRRLETTIRQVR